MLDINLLRRDLDGVIAKLETRKKPKPFSTAISSSSLRLGVRASKSDLSRTALGRMS